MYIYLCFTGTLFSQINYKTVSHGPIPLYRNMFYDSRIMIQPTIQQQSSPKQNLVTDQIWKHVTKSLYWTGLHSGVIFYIRAQEYV